jgi:hypothetical protein
MNRFLALWIASHALCSVALASEVACEQSEPNQVLSATPPPLPLIEIKLNSDPTHRYGINRIDVRGFDLGTEGRVLELRDNKWRRVSKGDDKDEEEESDFC